MPKYRALLTEPIVGHHSTCFSKGIIHFVIKLGERKQIYSLFDEILEFEGIKTTDVFEAPKLSPLETKTRPAPLSPPAAPLAITWPSILTQL